MISVITTASVVIISSTTATVPTRKANSDEAKGRH